MKALKYYWYKTDFIRGTIYWTLAMLLLGSLAQFEGAVYLRSLFGGGFWLALICFGFLIYRASSRRTVTFDYGMVILVFPSLFAAVFTITFKGDAGGIVGTFFVSNIYHSLSGFGGESQDTYFVLLIALYTLAGILLTSVPNPLRASAAVAYPLINSWLALNMGDNARYTQATIKKQAPICRILDAYGARGATLLQEENRGLFTNYTLTLGQGAKLATVQNNTPAISHQLGKKIISIDQAPHIAGGVIIIAGSDL